MIVGEGRLRGEIEALVADRGLQDSIQLLGTRLDIPDLMNACDAFVLASAWEGMPLVLLEAAACERVVVATEVGGAAEAVVAGKTGYLVRPGDSCELARIMDRVMSFPAEERDQMGKSARAHVLQRYSIRAVTNAYAGVYAHVLDTNPGMGFA